MISKTRHNLFALGFLAVLNCLMFLPAMVAVANADADADTVADPQANCFDDPDFAFRNDPSRDCSWVARQEHRCSFTWEGQEVREHCPDACGRCHIDSCTDDPAMRYRNNDERDCTWVGRYPPNRCSIIWKTRPLADFCPEMCGGCPSGKDSQHNDNDNGNDNGNSSPCQDATDFLFQDKPDHGCEWVAKNTGARCEEFWLGKKLKEACPVVCDACPSSAPSSPPSSPPSSSPSSPPSESVQFAPPLPPTDANADGCCSLDFKQCINFCGSTKESCLACDHHDGVDWLEQGPPQEQCNERWQGCESAPSACCPGLACREDFNGFLACLPSLPDSDTTDAPTYGPTYLVEERWPDSDTTDTPTYAPTSSPSSPPSESVQFAPPLPSTDADADGCCSLDFKQCINFCGSTKESCLACDHHDGVGWLEQGPPQEQCNERWQGCESAPSACCPGLACREDFNGFLACLPSLLDSDTTDTPTNAPTHLVEEVEERWPDSDTTDAPTYGPTYLVEN